MTSQRIEPVWRSALSVLVLTPVVLGIALAPVFARDGEAPKPPTSAPSKKPPAKAPKKSTPKTINTAPVTTPGNPAVTQRKTKRVARRRPRETAPSGLPPASERRFFNDQVIIRFQLDADQGAMNDLVRRRGLRHVEGRTFRLAGITVHRYEIAGGTPVSEIIPQIESDTTVVNAQPNYLYTLTQAAKGVSGLQYALDRMDIGGVHRETTGSGVTIAIIDSGIQTDHPGFSGATLEVVDVSDGGSADALKHGTAIAGVISAGGTTTGVAPSARMVAISAFSTSAKTGQVSGNSWTVAKAADAADDAKARVINMSFAGPADPLVSRSVAGLSKRGVAMFAASGNEGPESAVQYPAGYDEVYAITATDAGDAAYKQANLGPHLAFAAPGVEILSLAPGNGYELRTGTSIATAHISGLAALLIAKNPGITAFQIGEILQSASIDLGEPGRDPVFGYGIPNAGAALKALPNQ